MVVGDIFLYRVGGKNALVTHQAAGFDLFIDSQSNGVARLLKVYADGKGNIEIKNTRIEADNLPN